MKLTYGTYIRHNPDSTTTLVEIQSERYLEYHQDLLDDKGYIYEPSDRPV